jgi:hypothetical protein
MGYETVGTVKGHDRRTSITPRPPGPKTDSSGCYIENVATVTRPLR